MTSENSQFRYGAELATALETKWQARWEEDAVYRQPNPGEAGFDGSKPKFYCLDMFPYPSGAGLHVGHPEGYTATDILSRYKRARGYNVLHPMGWDAFGLPAEQYAIQTGIHPDVTTRKSIDNFRRQLKRFGFSYDWDREFGTIDPEYYRWTQWIFLQIYGAWFDPAACKGRPIADLVAEFENGTRVVGFNPDAAECSREETSQTFGLWSSIDTKTQHRIIDSWRLCYLAEQTVNWCPKLGTALANEEVIDGRSERGGYPVFRKPLRQWMFRITAYGDRLLNGLEGLDWPEATKAKQTGWIGRSEGAEIDFRLVDAPEGFPQLTVYTTRPDTLFGTTYMVVAPEHPLVAAVLGDGESGVVASYVSEARNRSDLERQRSKEKTGVPLGIDAVNPANGERIPVWVADYVLMGYGQGAIMAVPAHDERDFAFATTFGLPVVHVIEPSKKGAKTDNFYVGDGLAVRSSNAKVSLDGLGVGEAKSRIIDWLESEGVGRRQVNFRLRDWLFSRQRYWGEPFPIVYDQDGQHHAVGEETLPVKLPALADYAPEESEDPMPLLAKAGDWLKTTAAEAGVDALPGGAPMVRETNTMPGWAGSCWYYLRYCDPRNSESLAGNAAQQYWLGKDGIDLYVGGAEHAVLHLLYARFWHQVLYDLGHVTSAEPIQKMYHQGLIQSFAYQRNDKSLVPTDEVKNVGTEDKPEYVEVATEDSVKQIVAKMSKSLKNVVNPDDVIAEYGADTFRLYEMYLGPLDASKPWNPRDISGMYRFLQRTWRLLVNEESGELALASDLSLVGSEKLERLLHRTIAGVTEDLERMAFNTAIAKLIEFVNASLSGDGLSLDQARRFSVLISPFVPHMAEELWNKLGGEDSVCLQPWPTWEPTMLEDETVEIPVQVQGKLRAKLQVPPAMSKEDLEKTALAHERVVPFLEGKTVRKVIVVPGRLVNIVAT